MTSFLKIVPLKSGNKFNIPLYLCPFLRIQPAALNFNHYKNANFQRRQLQVEADTLSPISQLAALPRTCPGCGAFTQSIHPDEAGFYDLKRKSIKAFLIRSEEAARHSKERSAFDQSVHSASQLVLPELDVERLSEPLKEPQIPICNRCHDLIHHHSGSSIPHPTLQSIKRIIADSPYKNNHVYHILDAADFPLSLIPQLQRFLSISPQRSHNRRSKTAKFHHGKKTDMSFIITRSDLLAPRKEQVDTLMPYLMEVLRKALGSHAESVRLGNVRCVSAKRGWWTREVKEDVWNRGGGGWMVGKVNVGKSNLFECVFPKGRREKLSSGSFEELTRAASAQHQDEKAGEPDSLADLGSEGHKGFSKIEERLREDSLLPPPPIETPFPLMPVVSSLPGTTASPIRLPFGGGKGELIDLPGLFRSDLENYVQDEHKLDLVMEHRPQAEQFVIKHGQSLLLGGLIRITPTTPDVIVLAYPFVPLHGDVIPTDKAIDIHTQEQSGGTTSIAKPGIGGKMASAGTFNLKWDVTKKRAGPLTSRAAIGLNTQVLPFVVLSLDLLIEGCGWVELVAQVRKRALEARAASDGEFNLEGLPGVEVFSPEGRHIGAREPMSAWLLGEKKPKRALRRPRQSMKGAKKAVKLARRQSGG